jgi:hypothetical protein
MRPSGTRENKQTNKSAMQSCHARLPFKADLPYKAAMHSFCVRLLCKVARKGYWALLPGKAAGQCCKARLLGKAAG